MPGVAALNLTSITNSHYLSSSPFLEVRIFHDNNAPYDKSLLLMNPNVCFSCICDM